MANQQHTTVIGQAKHFMKYQQWAEAITELTPLACGDSPLRTPQRLLYQCYLRASRYNDAVALVDQMDPDAHADHPYLLGKAHYLGAHYTDALKCLDNPIAQASHTDATVLLTRTLCALSCEEKACLRIEELCERRDTCLLTIARCWEAAGQVSRAEQAYLHYLELETDPVGWSNLLKLQLNAREWGRAWQTLDRISQLGIERPDFSDARNRLSAAFHAAGLTPPLEGHQYESGRYRSSEMIVTAIIDRVLKRQIDEQHTSYRLVKRKSRRLVLVINSLGPGGAERQLVNLANAMVDSPDPYEVFVLCTYLDRSERDRFYINQLDTRVSVTCYFDRTRVIAVEQLTGLEGFGDLVPHLQPASRQQLVVQLAAELATLQPDIVQGWLDETFINTTLAGSMLGVPVVAGYWANTPPGVGKSLSERERSNVSYQVHAFRAIARLSDIRYASNSSTNGYAYAELVGLHPEQIMTIHNGIDEQVLLNHVTSTPCMRAQLGIPADSAIVGTVIRFVAQKRPLLWIETALKVVEQHPNVHFVLVGAGDHEPAMRELSRASGWAEHFHFVGTHSNVGAWLHLMDIFLLTSRIEGVPNAAIEAQLMGCSLVAPDVGGLSEAMLPEITGHLLSDHSAQSFANAVVNLLEKPETQKRFSKQAREFARAGFSVNALVDAHRQLFDLEPPAANLTLGSAVSRSAKIDKEILCQEH